jgi:hypothetical protein
MRQNLIPRCPEMNELEAKTGVMKLHSQIFVGNLLIKMYYPNVIAFLIKKVGFEEAKERIFKIGQESARKMLSVVTPKIIDIKSMIDKWFLLMWKRKPNKIKVIKEKGRIVYQIIDKNCGVCDPEATIEGLNMPCISIAGYLDACM